MIREGFLEKVTPELRVDVKIRSREAKGGKGSRQ